MVSDHDDDPLSMLEVSKGGWRDEALHLREKLSEERRKEAGVSRPPPEIRVLLPSYRSVMSLYYAKEVVGLHYPDHSRLEDLRQLYEELAGKTTKISEKEYNDRWPGRDVRGRRGK